MSAAKQKSSVTFLTIYSALSSSFDRAKHSISGDNAKTLSHNPSKRVTISDEAVPSGKRVLQEEEGGDSAKDKPSASSRTEANSPAAAMNLPAGKGASYKKAAISTKPLSQIATGEPTMAAMASHQQGKKSQMSHK
ncbi:hypothetical protein JRQ81_005880 [Phrynocephalus forsythii]|uniref:Uncharacterized protein n=1 Tax=Phrynocephalus forsythii TaxID=171643 RepID=A0A9Q1AVZ6_9SAUR|nr:hypothetical protein JRQ81_005880 [Phrynocephalus forsythii]